MNVIKGYPDLVCNITNGYYSGLAIEIKRPKTATQTKGYLSKEQKEWRRFLDKCGMLYVVCYSAQQIMTETIKYMGDV
jgi:hypothetical protein